MNEFLLAFATFILGILATVITQFFNRKFQLQEQRRQRRTERLADVEKWINSYRSLFQCKYPQLKELVLAHRYIDPNFATPKFDGDKFTFVRDKKAFDYVCRALMKFKEVEKNHKIVEKEAVFSLRALGANTKKPNLIIRAILYLRLKLSKYQSVYFVGDGFELWYPQGFLKEVAPHLSELKRQKDKLFYEFPRRIFYNIDWELLETVEFEQFSSLLIPRHPKRNFPELPKYEIGEIYKLVSDVDDYFSRFSEAEVYTEDEIELLESLDSMERCRQIAEKEIDEVLLAIEKYKTEWL